MSEIGNVKIANEVVKTIAAKAAGDVKGVYGLSGGLVDDVTKIFGKKKQTNGVKVEINESDCKIEIYLIVEYGYAISKVAQEVQSAVLTAVTELAGLNVNDVSVFVQDVKVVTNEEKNKKIKADEKIDSKNTEK